MKEKEDFGQFMATEYRNRGFLQEERIGKRRSMRKRARLLTVLIFIVIMTIGLSGCGKGEKKDEKGEEIIIEETGQADKESEEETLDISEEETSDSKEAASASQEAQPVELVEYGWYVGEASEVTDSVYINFCGILHNPNEGLTAEFPKVLVTVRAEDGSILGTEGQTGSAILPGDTVTLCGMLSVPAANYSENAKFEFDAECSDFSSDSSMFENVKTSDLVISNTSEKRGDMGSTITGEITNNSQVDLDIVNLSAVFRKDGKIVYMENTFIDDLGAGKSKAFELNSYNEWPEYDEAEYSAQQW